MAFTAMPEIVSRGETMNRLRTELNTPRMHLLSLNSGVEMSHVALSDL